MDNIGKPLQIFLCLIYLIFFPGIFHPQDKSQAVDKLLTELYNAGKFQGSVLIGNDSGIFYEKGFGYANLEFDIPNTPETKFRIASITKSFTSMLVMQFVQEGKLKLDAIIKNYLPEYPAKTGSIITIHQLLSHTSGLGHYEVVPDFFRLHSYLPYIHNDFIKLFQDAPLLFEPGARYSYSSFGYYLLGVILEKVSGKSYEELLNGRILNMLGMKNTSVDNSRRIETNRANGYEKTVSGLQNAGYRSMSTALAAGDMLSTVRDLYLWDRALYNDKLLSARFREIMFRPNTGGYGYGWSVNKIKLSNGRILRTVSHTGTTSGFRSIICRFIDKHTTIIILCNQDNADVSAISDAIRTILFNRAESSKSNNNSILYEDILKAK